MTDEDYSLYGFAGGKELEPGIIDANVIIEKPGIDKAPSDLATVSGYLFTPEIFDYLEKVLKNLEEGQELYYNDALKLMLEDGKRIIEDHFDAANRDLIENLKNGGEKKAHLLEEVEKISKMANFIYVRQKGPYGNGTPLYNARPLIGDEPFIYAFSDDFILAEPSRFKQMISFY